MAIPAQFIDELIARCDIADVVADYVPLSRKGGSLWGCCPFHSERTPSFHVVPERQMYKCFGCGKGGGVINFIMEIENLSYPDAVRFLAKRAGLTVPEEQGDGRFRRKRERLLALNREAARYFHSVLRSPAGQAGVEYLFGKRRLSKSTVTRFGLGMSPEGWDNLLTTMTAMGFEKSELLEAGLVVNNKEGRMYDRFRNRVMFPIIDLRGDVIGFGGRVLDDSTPKYLNSPDTPVFNKGRNLFALNIAKKSRLGRIILTEGYMDTLSLHQAGFDCAVASLGTALTGDHAQLLARYTKEVVIAYDGDGAGVSAAQRAIGLLEKTGMKVRVLRMKGAKDPDEFIKTYGPEAFAKLLDQSENHIEYRIDQVKGKYDLTDDAQRVEFLKESVPILAQLPSPAEREIYGARCAEMAGVSAEVVAQEVKRERSRRSWKEKKQQERRDLTPAVQRQPKERALRYDNLHSAGAEEGVLRLVMLDPELFGGAALLEPEDFSSPLLGRVFGLLRARWTNGLTVSLNALSGELESAEMNHLSGILTKPESLQNGDQAMRDYIEIIKTEAEKRRLEGASDELLAIQKKMLEKKAYGG
ncbi:DNA primase [Intestinimonas sp.]|uniref:DNA primase n=1 Tax=Intestinimonas sp. TaxID=1965293 RepID=UPI00261E4778|nr:DNA primase [Intestinimonas sp.]